MEYIKRIATTLLITLLVFCTIFYSYLKVNDSAIVYAETTRTLTNDELDAALTAYLESRGGNFFSAEDYRASVYFRAQYFNTWLFGEGSQFSREDFLQHVEVGKNQSDGMFFKFDGIATGFLANKMLGNNWSNEDSTLDTDTGLFDTGTEDVVYSGKLFDGQLVYVIPSKLSNTNTAITNFQIGTAIHGIKGNSYTLNNTYTYTYHNNTYTFKCVNANLDVIATSSPYAYGGSNKTLINPNYASYSTANVMYCSNKNVGVGNTAIIYINSNQKFYYGVVNKLYNSNKLYANPEYELNTLGDNTITNVDVNFYTNNNMNITNFPDVDVDGNLYVQPKVKVDGTYNQYTVNEGDNITNIINNYYQDSGTKDKTTSEPSTNPNGNTPPAGGTQPNWNNPYPNLTPDGEGGFNFNFTLPDLNIDWNINGLTEKFPFSIPFDFLAFCRVLNAEPQTPQWSGTLVLPMYSHQFTFSLSQFDTVAVILRNLEFIGFCIGLILATRSLIKG